MSVHVHKQQATQLVRCKIITVSDTRTKKSDKSGAMMIELLKQYDMQVTFYEIVKDELSLIQKSILDGCAKDDVDVMLINGGTGITKRDITIEAVQALIHKEIVGFGELFRMLSYTEDIGSAAIMSRAIAGTIHEKAVFSMPGSSDAVCLAMEKLILPELPHVVWELNRQK